MWKIINVENKKNWLYIQINELKFATTLQTNRYNLSE